MVARSTGRNVNGKDTLSLLVKNWAAGMTMVELAAVSHVCTNTVAYHREELASAGITFSRNYRRKRKGH